MKHVLLITMFALVACDNASFEYQPLCESQQSDTEVIITCGTDITTIPIPTDGKDGTDGQDGDDALIYSEFELPKSSCVQVADGLWAENIYNGQLMDVYFNPSCADNQGEVCDNVVPSYGRAGTNNSDKHPGSGTVCSVDNLLITVSKDSKNAKDMLVRVIEFK